MYDCDLERIDWMERTAELARTIGLKVSIGRARLTIEKPDVTRRKKRRARKKEAES